MLKKARSWVLLTMTLLLVGMVLCMSAVYLVDPFEHYRESAILPLYDQESYNNPGIARNYDYDAVILGTSMVEMSHPSVIDACFGVHSVKLPMRGSYTAHMGWQLTHVLSTHELKLAILAVDAYSLMGKPDDDDEIYDYLWNDDPLDDVHYMYQWTDVVFSKQSVLDAVVFSAQKDMQPADSGLERSTENILRHLEPSIRDHPETTFKIYMPPYSVGYWYMMTRGGLSEQQYRARARVCELLLQYPNVEIYDFSSRIEWITDLDSYFDYSHHSSAMSDEIMHAMAEGESRVLSAEDMDAGSERIRQAVTAFADEYEPK